MTLFSLLFLSFLSHAQMQPIDEVFAPDATKFPTKDFVKVAVIAWNPELFAPIGEAPEVLQAYVQKNRETLAIFMKEAAANGAELITTPEFAVVGYPNIPELPPEEDNYRNREDIKPMVETIPGPTTEFFSKLAVELKVTLHVGMAEVDAKTDDYHNTIVVINPQGKIVTKYHKMHLYQDEANYLVPGKAAVTYDSPLFGRVGIAVCSDVYSDHPMNDYVRLRPNILAISTSWADHNSGWRYFTEAATKLSAYTLAANHRYFPDSGVINPDGSAQSHIRQTGGLAYGFVPRKK